MKIISTNQNGSLEQKKFPSASATVIAPNSLVESASGLIVTATATGAKLGYVIGGKVAGETTVSVVIGNDYEIVLNANQNFAAADRNIEHDLVISGSEQQIDLSATTTKVLTVCGDVNGGTVGQDTDIRARIADGKALV